MTSHIQEVKDARKQTEEWVNELPAAERQVILQAKREIQATVLKYGEAGSIALAWVLFEVEEAAHE